MHTQVKVSCDHKLSEYQLSNDRLSLHAAIVSGKTLFSASGYPFGCGREYDTPRKAIENLLRDNGCINIVIHSDTIDDLSGI